MKKILSILVSACIVMLVACGPSAEEKAAAEKAIQDSIANVLKMQEDSIAAAMEKQRADSLAAAIEQMRVDSAAAAEAAKKAPRKKTNEQKMQEDKKVLDKQKG